MADFDIIIVGGGALGLACAKQLFRPQTNLLVAEADKIGNGLSTHTSKFLHLGRAFLDAHSLYHLADFGVERKRMLQWCPEHLEQRAAIAPHANYRWGVLQCRPRFWVFDRLRREGPEMATLANAPAPKDAAAILRPGLCRGVITQEILMDDLGIVAKLQSECINDGIDIAEDHRLVAATATGGWWQLVFHSASGGQVQHRARRIVNAAGPAAAQLLAKVFSLPAIGQPPHNIATHIAINPPAPLESILLLDHPDVPGMFVQPYSDRWYVGVAEEPAGERPDFHAAKTRGAARLIAALGDVLKIDSAAIQLQAAFTSLRMFRPERSPYDMARTRQHVITLHNQTCPPLASILYGRMEWLHRISEDVESALARAAYTG